jgi:hypothetical protein
VTLSWTGGSGQTGYQVWRIPLDGSPAVVLPPTGPLPASATSFVDAPAPGSLPCYLLFVFGPPGVAGVSDLLCRFDGIRSGSPPANFTLRLNESTTASLSWSAVAGASGYVLQAIPLTGAPVRTQTFGPGMTSTTDTIGADFTCYAVAATGVATNVSDLLCGQAGWASFSATTAAGAALAAGTPSVGAGGPGSTGQVAAAVRAAAGPDPAAAVRRAARPSPSPTASPSPTPRPRASPTGTPRPIWCARYPQYC